MSNLKINVSIYCLQTFEPPCIYHDGWAICTIWFGWVLWDINHCRLLNAKSSFYTYIKHIGFCLVDFIEIATTVGNLIPNPLYTYTLNIYDLLGFGCMAYLS